MSKVAKARLAARGHQKPSPASLNKLSAVSKKIMEQLKKK